MVVKIETVKTASYFSFLFLFLTFFQLCVFDLLFLLCFETDPGGVVRIMTMASALMLTAGGPA